MSRLERETDEDLHAQRALLAAVLALVDAGGDVGPNPPTADERASWEALIQEIDAELQRRRIT